MSHRKYILDCNRCPYETHTFSKESRTATMKIHDEACPGKDDPSDPGEVGNWNIVVIDLKKRYLEKPQSCPYCDSDKLDGGEVKTFDEDIRQRITCFSCKRTWTDVMTVTDVVFESMPQG